MRTAQHCDEARYEAKAVWVNAALNGVVSANGRRWPWWEKVRASAAVGPDAAAEASWEPSRGL